VIDDEPSVREIAQTYLEEGGYEVLVAENGAEGLALSERAGPAIIVLDLMLPDMSGEQVCREIRSRSDVPIIMLTAKAREEERIAGLASGADDYLVKPFSPRESWLASARCCGGRTASRPRSWTRSASTRAASSSTRCSTWSRGTAARST
jgi:DNA-binding response OmpR family regulator